MLTYRKLKPNKRRHFLIFTKITYFCSINIPINNLQQEKFCFSQSLSDANNCCVDADCQSSVKQCVRGRCEPLQCAPTLDGANGKLVTTGSRELGKNAALVCDEGHYYPKAPFGRRVAIFCDKKSTELKWTQTDGSDIVACIKGFTCLFVCLYVCFLLSFFF
jgi:hypothetical protein